MIALGPKLKLVQGNRTVQKAFDFPYHSNRWEVQDFQPLVEQFGGKLLSDDGKTAGINSPAAVKALTLWVAVTKAGGDPRTTMNTPSNPNQDFVDGRTAMWITGPWATPQVLIRRTARTSRWSGCRRSIRRSRTPWSTAGCGA